MKQLQEYQPFDPAEFDKVLQAIVQKDFNSGLGSQAVQNGLKAGSTEKRSKNSIDKEKNAQQGQQQQKQKPQVFNAIQPNILNPIDRAFYRSLDRNITILSDSYTN